MVPVIAGGVLVAKLLWSAIKIGGKLLSKGFDFLSDGSSKLSDTADDFDKSEPVPAKEAQVTTKDNHKIEKLQEKLAKAELEQPTYKTEVRAEAWLANKAPVAKWTRGSSQPMQPTVQPQVAEIDTPTLKA